MDSTYTHVKRTVLYCLSIRINVMLREDNNCKQTKEKEENNISIFLYFINNDYFTMKHTDVRRYFDNDVFLFGEFSSSSGCLGWATLFYCGTH